MNYLIGLLVIVVGVINLMIGIKGKTIGSNEHKLSNGQKWIYKIAGVLVIVLGIMYVLGLLPQF